MSTDLHDRTRQPLPEEGPDQPERPKSSLSVAQVVGGALAAMTAAALGSRLSVAGTVVGAALASIVAAVGGAVYTASLRRTSRHVSAVLTRVRPGAPDVRSTAPSGPTSGRFGSADDDPLLTSTSSWELPADPQARTARRGDPGRTLRWRSVLVGALLMFVLAALTLTGVELATGRALSGGTGTTVGQVAEPATRASATPTRRASSTPSATPSADSSASAASSTSASATPSSEPAPVPSSTASAAPSTTPTSTPTPSSTPSVSASPSVGEPAS